MKRGHLGTLQMYTTSKWILLRPNIVGNAFAIVVMRSRLDIQGGG